MNAVTRSSFVALIPAFVTLTGAYAQQPAAQPAEQPKKSPGQVFIPPESKGKVIPHPVPVQVQPSTSVNPPTGTVAPMPEALDLAEKSFDWGDIPDTEPVEHVVKFKNKTATRIKVQSMASCGCTVTTMTKTEFEPGEEGTVTARFDPHNRPGMQSKTITFTIQEPANTYGMQTVVLTANVKSLVTFDPPRLFSNDVDHRDGKVERVTIIGRKAGFAVTSADSSSEFVKVTILEPKQIESGNEKLTHIPVELLIGKDAPIGKLEASITFNTNDERAKPQPYFLGADVVGDVKVTPAQAIARVNTPNTSFTTEMRLDSRSGSPFKITGIEVEARKDMQVAPDVRPGENGRYYMLSLSGVTPNEQGMFTGFVTVTTEGNGSETLRIPFSAAVSRPVGMNQPPAMGGGH